jgi:hypothetical protein
MPLSPFFGFERDPFAIMRRLQDEVDRASTSPARAAGGFHEQLAYLWRNNGALRQLRREAIVSKDPGGPFLTEGPFAPERDVDRYPAGEHEIDLCGEILQFDRGYIPLVRGSLNLNCHLDILCLRQEDPGALVLQGGDLDGRMKTLFDALSLPPKNEPPSYESVSNPTYCLLESDTLISGFSVRTDRLLRPATTAPNEVHITIEVILRVLRLGMWNTSLVGG